MPSLPVLRQQDGPGGADFDRSCQDIRERLGARIAPVTVPIGAADTLEGVVDLVTREAVYFRGDQGSEVVREAIPAALVEEMEVRRSDLVETLADFSDEIAAMFLGGEDPGVESLTRALREATLAANVFPVLSGAALRNVGIQPLLDAVVDFLPSPLDVPPAEGSIRATGRRSLARRTTPRRFARWSSNWRRTRISVGSRS